MEIESYGPSSTWYRMTKDNMNLSNRVPCIKRLIIRAVNCVYNFDERYICYLYTNIDQFVIFLMKYFSYNEFVFDKNYHFSTQLTPMSPILLSSYQNYHKSIETT